MPFRTPLSLRALVLIGSGLLSVCGVVAVTSLVTMTNYLHTASVTISEAVNSVVAAEELQKNLLEYSRDRMMLALKGGQITEAAVDESESRIRHWYSRIEMHASSVDEQQNVTEVQRLIDGYINSRRVEQMNATPEQVFANGRQYLDPARIRIRDLVMLNQKQAEEAQKNIDDKDRQADRLGAVISATLAVVIIALLYGLRIQVYKPLVALRQAIESFGQGNLEVRAAPQGPREIREITRNFNDLVDGQKRAKESHYRFLAGVAHDLRNPLSALRMSFELVSTARPDEQVAKKEIEAIAKRQIDQLDQMIGDLLDSSRIESGKFTLNVEARDLRLDLQQAVALHRSVSSAHSISLRVPDGNVRCEYDSLRMSQILNNLVSNALKYSPSGGTVSVSLEQSKNEAVIEVKDEGIGIASEDLSGIFEPFRRSRITRDTIPGVGLGLAVAKRLVEAHGGRLEVESVEGMGSTFRVRIPHREKVEAGSIVAYLSATANDLVTRGGRSHATEVSIEQG